MRFDMSPLTILAATPAILKLFNATDNPTYYTSEGTEPTTAQWLLGLVAGANGTCKIEVGLTNTAKDAFTPSFAVYVGAAFTFVVPDLGRHAYKLDKTHATINILALRVTVPTNTTTLSISGAVDHGRV